MAQSGPRPERVLRPGWWRRNVWGLVLLPVAVVAALIGPFVDTAYRDFFQSEPRVPVAGTSGAWVSFAGGRMRLLQLETVVPVDYGKKPITVTGAKVWHARVGYDAPAESSKFGGCRVFLEDAEGRTFSADPVELSGADVDSDLGCGAPTLSASPPPSAGALVQYEISYYFVLPASARAAALRITVATETPRFARLTPPS